VVNAELLQLYREDLQERRNHPEVGTEAYRAMRERDSVRRSKAGTVLAVLANPTRDDLFHAAWVFQHGDGVADVSRAHELALEAVRLGHPAARWLSAAAFDRWCMYRGEPQRFGTQIVPDGLRYRVWDVDPATTDDERALWNVPSLTEQHRRATELSRTSPQPSMADAPAWLREAIQRWYNLNQE
jgi:hypothetical protein